MRSEVNPTSLSNRRSGRNAPTAALPVVFIGCLGCVAILVLALPGVLDASAFPNHSHLDLSWIYKVVFNFLDDVPGQL